MLVLVQKIELLQDAGRNSEINCNREKLECYNQIFGKHGALVNQRHETGRLKHTRTHEYMTTVDEMVGLLNHKGQKQTYRSIRQISKEMDLTKCSIVQITHCIFGQKCISFSNMLAVYS